ncbi:hypothetical protein [Kitasatospora purpeofusca]|uniref:hypothetical protein n=1 Tax=Kitasatospora purpeofusca TaxID=67352 RepID=UPI0036891D2C
MGIAPFVTALVPTMHVVWDWNGMVRDDLDDHFAALNATLPALGDAVDDADTAHAYGAFAVLHTGGLHNPAKLAAAGLPLAQSLTDAVALSSWLIADAAHPAFF